MAMRTGFIFVWSGAVADIPYGWCLCDGRTIDGETVPDLRDYFVPGAGSSYDPDDSGGSLNHNHGFTGSGHQHFTPGGSGITAPGTFDFFTSSNPIVGTFDNSSSLCPYYALCFVMKL